MLTENNIKLIGELYKVELLPIQIMIICMNDLFQITEDGTKCLEEPDENKIECSLNLLQTIGEKLSKTTIISKYIEILNNLSKLKDKLSSRIRFACDDIIKLSKNNWIPKHQESKPTTLIKARMYPE